jgi:hypothetical protein
MKSVLEDAAQQAGRHPDMVLAGHVHNYQPHEEFRRWHAATSLSAQAVPQSASLKKVDGKAMIPPVVSGTRKRTR